MKPLTRNALTFVAGYCDTATFITMDGLFSAHVTGNFVLFAAALANGVEPHDYLKILTFPIFVLAVVIGTVLYHRTGSGDPAQRYQRLLQAMTCLLIVAASAAFIPAPWTGAVVTMTVVTALGMQNAMHHFLPGAMTTVMTGTVMHTAASFTERYLLRRTPAQPAKESASLIPSYVMIVTFLLGCVVAAIATLPMGLKALVVPAFLMLGVVMLERRS